MNKRPLPCVLAGFVLGEVWIYQFKETAAIAACCLAAAVLIVMIRSGSRRKGSFFASFFATRDYFPFSLIGKVLLPVIEREKSDFFCMRKGKKKPLFETMMWVSFLAGILFGGVRQWNWNGQKEAFSLLFDKDTIWIEGQVEEKKTTSQGISLVLRHIVVEGDSYPGKIQIYLEKEPVFVIGSYIKMKGEIEPFSLPTNPGEFNQRTYQEGKGILGCCYQPEIEKVSYGSFLIWDAIMEFREKTGYYLQEKMGKKQQGVAMAMLLGDKSELMEEQKNLFQVGGISHILAVSGLHMTLIGAGIYKLFRKMGLPYGIAVFCSFPCIFLYAVMTGMGSSCLRAAIMLSVYLVAEWKGLSYDLPSSLALSGLLLLWEIPARLFDSGFLLSYGALFGVGIGYPFLKERVFGTMQIGRTSGDAIGVVKRKKRLKNAYQKEKQDWLVWMREKREYLLERAKEQLLSGISITVFTLPLSLYFFYGISLAGLLLNLLVIPLMSLLVPLLAFGGVGWISWYPGVVGEIFLFLGGKIIDFYLSLCGYSEKIPGSYLQLGYRGLVFALFYYGSLGSLAFIFVFRDTMAKGMELKNCNRKVTKVMKRDRRKQNQMEQDRKGNRFLFLSWIIFAMGLIWISGKRGAYLTMLDVGQGDGILYHSREGTVCMVDGGSTSKKKVGSYVIQSALSYYGIGEVDYWFVSHTDEDHISGLVELLEKGYSVGHLILSERREKTENQEKLEKLAKKNGTQLHYMSRGQCISLKHSEFYCLHPKKGASGEDVNQDSMVLMLEEDGQQILLTGDVEKEGEAELTRALKSYQEKRKKSQKVKILKTAHHGSKNATQEDFLRVFAPNIALISAGRKNRYGHPSAETLERLKKAGTIYYNTATVGAIEVQLGSNTRYYQYGYLLQ